MNSWRAAVRAPETLLYPLWIVSLDGPKPSLGVVSVHFIGLSFLSLTMVCWEVTLSKGQEWDWFNDAFGRVQTLATLFVVGLTGLVLWETRHSNPIVNFRPLRNRNFALACLIIFFSFGILYGSSTLLPSLLESLFGYDAFHAGLVMSPAGFFTIPALIVVGALLGRSLDARWLVAIGLLILAAGNFWTSQLNLEISPGQVVWQRVVIITGLDMVFAPLNVAAFLYIPRELRGAAVGLFALLRNEGGSVGISIGQTFAERRDIFHALRLNENLDQFNPAANSYLDQAQAGFSNRPEMLLPPNKCLCNRSRIFGNSKPRLLPISTLS